MLKDSKSRNLSKIFYDILICTFVREARESGFSVDVKVSYVLVGNMIFALSTARKLYFVVFSVKRPSVWVS